MSGFTRDQALAFRRAVLAHVGGLEVDPTAPGPAAWVILALRYVLSLFSLFTGQFIPVETWTRLWSFTVGPFVVFATELDPNNIFLVAVHEGLHVRQFFDLGLKGVPEDGMHAAMWFVYLFSREGRARLEAAAFAAALEFAVRVFGWGHDECRDYVLWMRDVSLVAYGLTEGERDHAARIVDSHAAALLNGTAQTTAYGAWCVAKALEIRGAS